MSEYFDWVNIDKKELISPIDFDQGSKRYESLLKNSTMLTVLYALLDDEWKGDHILWLGDEAFVPAESSIEIFNSLYKQTEEAGYAGSPFAMICDYYKNVSCIFQESESEVRGEIENYLDSYRTGDPLRNEYGIDIEHPFEGLFQKKGRKYQFIINHTKKIYYSHEDILIIDDNNKIYNEFDPFPILMGFGRQLQPGKWIGDIIGVSDIQPEGYTLLEKIYVDW